jgi:hypothetical protein
VLGSEFWDDSEGFVVNVAAHMSRGLSYGLLPIVVLSGLIVFMTSQWLVVAARLPPGRRFGVHGWEYVKSSERWMYLRSYGPFGRFSCMWFIPSLKIFVASGFTSAMFYLFAFVFNGFVNPAPL